MRYLKIFLVFSMVFAFTLAMVGFAAAAEEKCPLCGMKLAGNENTAYVITTTDGKTTTYCCPHCGLSVHAESKAKVKSAKARDFISGEWMDPAKMVFLFKSTAVPACAPSWIAFGSKAEAEKFQRGFAEPSIPLKKPLRRDPNIQKAWRCRKSNEYEASGTSV